MSKNKTFLINNVENNLSVESISDIIKNWELLYPTVDSAVSGIVTYIVNYSKKTIYAEADIHHLFALLESHIISTTDGIFNVDDILKSIETDNLVILDRLNIIKDRTRVNKRISTTEDNIKKIYGKIDVEDIIENYKMANYNKYCIDGIQELCHQISSTFSNIDDSKKVCICAESVKMILEKARIKHNNSEVLKGVVEYFIISGMAYTKINEGVDNIKTYYDIEDDIKIEVEDDTEEIEESEYMFLMQVPVVENKFKLNKITNIKDSVIRNIAIGDLTDSIQKIPEILYKVRKDDIIGEVPSLLIFVRKIILYGGSIAINPILAIPVIIIDRLIEIKINRKNAKQILADLEFEKLNTIKSLKGKSRDKCDEIQMLIDELDNQISRVTEYLNSLGVEVYESVHDTYNSTDIAYEGACILAIEASIKAGTLTEGSFQSFALSAKEKLTKFTQSMSAKEKSASRTLDSTIDKYVYEVRKSLELNNRDRVVEGKLLPSASKTIKLAIGVAAAWAVSPAIAVISSIAAIGIAKNTRDRERQIILDDISMHLTIVEKKIYQAEMNNDLEAMEQLMRLETTLKREKQRIEYRRKVYR